MPFPIAPPLVAALWRRSMVRAMAGALVLVCLMSASYVLAFELRFDFEVPPEHALHFQASLLAAVLVKTLAVLGFQLHRNSWRHASLREVEATIKAAAAATLVLIGFNFLTLELRGFPRSIYVLDFLISVGLVSGALLSVRMLNDRLGGPRGKGRRLLIIGGGSSGEQLLRQLGRNAELRYAPVGILDDDPGKLDLRVHGVPVVGAVRDLVGEARRLRIEELIIATPSATVEEMRRVVAACRETGLPFKVLPRTETILEDAVSWRQLREVQVEDLLRREPVELDAASMADFLDGKVVMVTGAGGSIGSELCAQVLRWRPRRLLAVERTENALYHLLQDLKDGLPPISPEGILGDVTDQRQMDRIIRRARPDVVIHAAAHKHVPLVEANVAAAVHNNIFGTRCVAEAAARHGAGTFLLISTDKAVNPTSVMGSTKRVAELVLQDLSHLHPDTSFVAVRFGNVLGSNGSVIPRFKKQIARGGPVTVTHPDMTRYFMSIPEACALVLQAAALGDGGEVFVLDMGSPVRIVDLAEDLIRMSGLEPGVDIDITFTGVRPGEKLFEELMLEDEGIQQTHHQKIFLGRVAALPHDELVAGLEKMAAAVDEGDAELLRTLLAELVPEALFRRGAAVRGLPVERPRLVKGSK